MFRFFITFNLSDDCRILSFKHHSAIRSTSDRDGIFKCLNSCRGLCFRNACTLITFYIKNLNKCKSLLCCTIKTSHHKSKKKKAQKTLNQGEKCTQR